MINITVVESGYGFDQSEVGNIVEVIDILYHEPSYFSCVIKDQRGFTRKAHHNSFGVTYSELKKLFGNN